MADWQSLARRAARQTGVDPNVFVRLVRQESGGRPGAVSPAGAIGYTQLMPGTARGLGVDPRDPWQNLLGGARYLKQQLNTFGNYSDALRAYNAGPGAVKASHGYAETNAYVNAILGGAANRPASGSTTAGGAGGLSVGPDSTSTGDVSALLSMLSQPKTAPSSMGIPAPSFAAGPAMPAGYQAPASSGAAAQSQAPDISDLLALVRTQPGGENQPAAGPGSTTGGGRSSAAPAAAGAHTASFDGKTVAGWIAPALSWARAHGWKGTVVSGLRSTAQQAGLYADFKAGRRAGPVAPPGHSRHEGSQYPYGAVDVSDPDQLAAILRGSPYANRLQWAGARDRPHFSHQFGGTY